MIISLNNPISFIGHSLFDGQSTNNIDLSGYLTKTGFSNNNALSIEFNETTRKIEVTGIFQLRYNGNLIVDNPTGTKYIFNLAAPITTANLFLYYGANGLVWSTTAWTENDAHISKVFFDNATNYMFATYELHGFMQPEVHRYIHRRLRTYKISGGSVSELEIGVDSDAARRPVFGSLVVGDEDIERFVNTTSKANYTLYYNSGTTSTLSSSFAFTNPDIFIKNTQNNFPVYNQINGNSEWVLLDIPQSNFFSIFEAVLIVADDLKSQLYRRILVQPQSYGTLEDQRQITPISLNMGALASMVEEITFCSQIIFEHHPSGITTYKEKKLLETTMLYSSNTIQSVQQVDLTPNRFTQTTASPLWVIDHTLGYQPFTEVYILNANSEFEKVEPVIISESITRFSVEFNVPYSGYVLYR